MSIGTALALPCAVELRNLSKKDQIRDLIQKDKQGFISKYRRMEGYAQLAKKMDIEMGYLFMVTSKYLTPQEKRQLEWQAFRGFVQKLNQLKSKIKDKDGKIKQKFTGMDGQERFAQKHFYGNMFKSFKNVSAVLSPREMKQLEWQQFHGFDQEYNRLKSLITDESGNIRSDFLKNYEGMDGLARFAEEHFDENMLKAFVNVSAVLGGVLIMRELELGWKAFYGTTDQYSALIKFFEETTFEELQNLKGQQMVADLIFKGHKINAYKNVSSLKERLLNKKEDFKNLNWRR